MSDLPTRAAIFSNARDALDQAYSALSDARDWLKSDWAPVGSELTPEAARARTSMLRRIEVTKSHIDQMQGDVANAIDSLGGRIVKIGDRVRWGTIAKTFAEGEIHHLVESYRPGVRRWNVLCENGARYDIYEDRLELIPPAGMMQ